MQAHTLKKDIAS